MSKNNSGSLSLKVKLGYGAGDLGGNLFFTVVAFWLMNYLTDEAGLSAGLAGMALMVGKIWDAVTDPAVGFLSDRTRTRWGRRRPWILAGSFPLGIALWFMFTNPGLTDQKSLFIWASLSYMFLCMTYTFVNIPYNALTPELTKDYHERTVLNGYRMMFAVVGTLLGAGAALPIRDIFNTPTTGYMAMGALFGAVMTISALIPFFTVKEPAHHEAPPGGNIFKMYLEALKNRPYVLILIPWALNIIGITIVTGSLIYYFKYVLNNEASMTPAMVIMLLGAMLFIPLSVIVSKKIGKKETYILGMSIFSLAALNIFFFGHLMGINFLFITMFFAGIGLSAHYVMPWAIVPDTVEYDYAQSGIRKEGIYYSLWTFSIKLGQAVAALMVGFILEFFGYIPNAVQSADSLFGIRFIIGPATVVFIIIANIVLYFYPINKKQYELLLKEIARKETEQ